MSYHQHMNEVAEILQGIVKAGIRPNIMKAFHSLDENDEIKYENAISQLNRITSIDKDWINGLIRRNHVMMKGEKQ